MALHLPSHLPPLRPFNPSLSQPEYYPPSIEQFRRFQPSPTLHPSIKCSKPVLATTTTTITGPSPTPPPPPLRPRRNYKHSFHTKSRWRCPALRPETSPARVAFSLRIATRPLPSAPNHRVLVPLADEVQTPFPNSRAITGGDDSVQTRAKFGPSPNFCPCRQPPNAVFHREAKILMTLPAGGSAAHVDG